MLKTTRHGRKLVFEIAHADGHSQSWEETIITATGWPASEFGARLIKWFNDGEPTAKTHRKLVRVITEEQGEYPESSFSRFKP